MMENVGLEDLSHPEAILDHIIWKPGLVDVAQVYRTFTLPQVVKIDSGDYRNFGTGTNVDVQKPFLLFSNRNCRKVLAASVRWDEALQQYMEVGHRLVIPLSYPGWFSFLQEGGKAGQTWKTIEEVAKGRPDIFLTRTPVPCYMYSQQARSGERFYLKETIPPGQLLYASDVYTETVTRKKPTCCFNWLTSNTSKVTVEEIHYLQAADSTGRELLLEFTQQGEFSEIGEAGTARTNSVYCLGDLVKYVDLPVNTKLAYGLPPSTPCSFTGMLKLEELYLEETIIACSLGGPKHVMVEFPTDSEIQFIIARNNAQIMDSILLHQAMNHCENHIDEYVNSIKVVQTFYPDHVKPETSIAERTLPPVPSADQIQSASPVAELTSDDEKPVVNHHQSQVTVDINVQALAKESKSLSDLHKEESHYEVIPGDVYGTREVEDDQGYLVPVQVASPRPVMPRPKGTKVAVVADENGYLKQKRSLEPENAAPSPGHLVLPDSVTELLEKHLRERLDRFLMDSVQEFHRIQSQNALDDDDNNGGARARAPETKEDLQQYLESLFDWEKMTQEQSASTPRPRFKRLHSSQGIWDFQMNSALEDSPRVPLKRRNSATTDAMLPLGCRTPIRFSLSNPDATIRRHNLEQVLRPAVNALDFKNDASGIPQPQISFPSSSGTKTPNDFLQTDNHTFVPIDIPSSTFEVQPEVPQSPCLSRDKTGDHVGGPRTDSGIFISCPPWSDPYTMDSDSPYRTGSESSNWAPPGDLSTASVQEVVQSLQYIGMKDNIVKLFYDEQIDGKQLLDLDDHLLGEGFPQLNALDRKKIVDFINGWRPKKL